VTLKLTIKIMLSQVHAPFKFFCCHFHGQITVTHLHIFRLWILFTLWSWGILCSVLCNASVL